MICLKDLIKGHRIYHAPAKQPSLFNLDQAESAKLFHNANNMGLMCKAEKKSQQTSFVSALATYTALRAKKSLTFFECDARNGWGARNQG